MHDLTASLEAIANRLVAEIAAAVRKDVLAEVQAVIAAGAKAPAAPEHGTRGRASKKPTVAGKRKPGRGVRSFTDADLDRVLEAVKANPGKLPSQVWAKSGVAENAFDAGVKWLKKHGKLKVVGKGRSTTYQVVG